MTQPAEVQLYLDRAKDGLKQAEDNLKLGYYDVATSRAYYAMFYATSALLVTQGISRSKRSGVQAAFGQYFVQARLDRARVWQDVSQRI